MAELTELLDEIRQRIDIVEFISHYAKLKRIGRNYRALCPFHSERTPSFMVSPDKGLWHCFGCGRGGTLFNFVMEQENLNFMEAVRKLAQQAGLFDKLRTYTTIKDSARESIYKINELAALYYHKILLDSEDGKPALNYLLGQRGLQLSTIKSFKLGYATNKINGLCKFLAAHGYDYPLQEQAGLTIAAATQENSYYDRFRGRIMFPICDLLGRIVGFGGRLIQQQEAPEAPKYLNSPETSVFNKSRLLYGLNSTKNKIAKADLAIVVEGYIDFLMLQQAGIEPVVATMGTALTYEHLNLLSRFTKHLVLAFDADSAGMQATLRTSEMFEASDIDAKIVCLPQNQDPDEYIKKYGSAAFYELIKQAKPVIEYKIQMVKAAGNYSDVYELLEQLVPILAELKNVSKLNKYAHLVAEELSKQAQRPMDAQTFEQSLIDAVKQYWQKQKKGITAGSKATPDKDSLNAIKQPTNKQAVAERGVISALLSDPEKNSFIISQLKASDFSQPLLKEIFQAAAEMLQQQGRLELSKLSDMLSSGEAKALISQLYLSYEQQQEEGGAAERSLLKDYIQTIRDGKRKERLKELEEEIKAAVSAGRLKHDDPSFIEYQELQSYFRCQGKK